MIGKPPLDYVTLAPFFGHIRLAARIRPEVSRVIGEARSWRYDHKGELVEDTGWEATGAVIL